MPPDTDNKDLRREVSPWVAGGATAMGLIGTLLNLYGGGGGPDLSGLESVYNAAMRGYQDLMDPQSAYNRSQARMFKETAASSQPTIGTLYGINRGAGLSGKTSNYLVHQQIQDVVAKTNEIAGQMMLRALLQNQQSGAQYLGVAGTMQESILKAQMAQQDTETSFWGSILEGGIGMLPFMIMI